MSETEQKETELVTGTIQGIIQKAADKWQVAVKPDGSNYDKKLWTKDADLVDALSVKIGQAGAFACNVSHWTNNEGKAIRSLWIENLSDGAAPAAAPRGVIGQIPQTRQPASDGMSKEEWARKDSAIHMMAAIKTAADALKHTIPSDPTPEDLTKYLERCKRLSWDWWKRADAVRAGDDSDVPFLSEHDEGIPY